MKYSIFIQCCFVNLSVTRNVIIFNNGEVTDVLAWPPNNFLRNKNVCTENLQYISMKWSEQSIRFCICNECWFCVFSSFCTKIQLLCKLINYACASFSLSIKSRADFMLVCFYVSMLSSVVLVITSKLLSELLFWKFMSFKSQDDISS